MFIQQLEHAQDKNQSLVCVGLDPNADKIDELGVDLLTWLKAIVDATADHVCAFKPQIAYFSALKAEDELTQQCRLSWMPNAETLAAPLINMQLKLLSATKPMPLR